MIGGKIIISIKRRFTCQMTVDATADGYSEEEVQHGGEAWVYISVVDFPASHDRDALRRMVIAKHHPYRAKRKCTPLDPW